MAHVWERTERLFFLKKIENLIKLKKKLENLTYLSTIEGFDAITYII